MIFGAKIAKNELTYMYRDYPDLSVQNFLDTDGPLIFRSYVDLTAYSPSDVLLNVMPNNMSLSNYAKEFLDSYSNTSDYYNYSIVEKPALVTIDNKTGYSFSVISDDDDTLIKYFLFTHGNHTFGLRFEGSTDGFNNLQYNRMIKSIKFFD